VGKTTEINYNARKRSEKITERDTRKQENKENKQFKSY
jgi:hypothetical protein